MMLGYLALMFVHPILFCLEIFVNTDVDYPFYNARCGYKKYSRNHNEKQKAKQIYCTVHVYVIT